MHSFFLFLKYSSESVEAKIIPESVKQVELRGSRARVEIINLRVERGIAIG
jgi:hypothetical protein